MRAIKLLSLVVTYMYGATIFLAASEPDKPVTVRVASYNVEFSKSATPEQIGEMFKPYKLDIIGFDEAPDGDWTARVGKILGMPYSFVGKISSANHKNKYKTILSRTPLEGTEEYRLSGRGWNPASAVRATTKIEGISFAFYSLHICKSGATDGHAYSLATKVLPKEITERVIVVGDFNNNIGDAAINTIEAAGFRSTWTDLKIDVSKEFTYNAQNPKKNLGVIDHIFYNTSSGAKANEGGIIELKKPLSDHKPIWAEIAFPRVQKPKRTENPKKAVEPKKTKTLSAITEGASRTYELWEPEPAPNNGRTQWEATKSERRPRSHDRDWERWSYPLGNGYAGACVFGRTDTERVQVTDKTLHNKGVYKKGGLTSFAELYLDFNQDDVRNYRRSLSLNEAIAHVSYEKDGVAYQREYFASYPDNVIVIRLTADQKGAFSFTVRPEIPYLEMKERTGSVTAEGNLLTLKGTVPLFSCNFEGQIKVLNEGGSVTVDSEGGTVEVSKADAVTLLIATGTNYRLSEKTFSNPPAKKLDPQQFPHDAVSARIQAAQDFGYAALKERHLKDYQNLFGRVSVNLNSTPSADPTHLLLEKYQQGKPDTWLEELMFQYGRYLLIASSRQKTLPANLQGTWSQHYHTPWSGGYWHNINVQMNYWGAMSANLPECFEAYVAFFKAYLPLARQHATDYVREHNPEQLTEGGDNGWIIGTGANAYLIPGAGGGHSGPGTGGFTAKLLVDYYRFTQDREFLEEVAYPAMLSLSRFYSKALVPHGDQLLVEPSASPEQTAKPEQIEGMPGHMKGKNYITAGCTFDQGFVWESFTDTLSLADKLGKKDPFLDTIREQVTKLDPILIGADGQIKEYREENNYSEIGQAKHRHISHLCPLFPGTLINSDHADWMQAASKTLDLRGNKTTGWALAHRMNSRARLGEGEKAHEAYERFIRERTVQNLWTLHPPFQIDGSLGTMAGVAEMLLQSHGDYIQILPALPAAWNTGYFNGLVARGNFVISVKWKEGKATEVSILSRSGGECRIVSPSIGNATVTDSGGNTVKIIRNGKDRIRFASAAGERYAVEFR